MLLKKFRSWKISFNSHKVLSTMNRQPFFDIAQRYLPENRNSIIVDLGSGNGEFGTCGDICSKYDNFYLLDGNVQTVHELRAKFRNVIKYTAPGPLPFKNGSVSYVHCSHFIEHLFPKELYNLLEEVDRVLKFGGILAVSAPLLYEDFYYDLSHIRPYYPQTLMRYLTFYNENYSATGVSQKYRVVDLKYRYKKLSLYEDGIGLGSEHQYIDLIIQAVKKILSFFKIRYYIKNGFTIILEKGASS